MRSISKVRRQRLPSGRQSPVSRNAAAKHLPPNVPPASHDQVSITIQAQRPMAMAVREEMLASRIQSLQLRANDLQLLGNSCSPSTVRCEACYGRCAHARDGLCLLCEEHTICDCTYESEPTAEAPRAACYPVESLGRVGVSMRARGDSSHS